MVSKDNLNLGSLPQAIQQSVTLLGNTLLDNLQQGNLLSISVVGSSLTDDFHPRYSDINSVVVVSNRSHAILRTLAKMGRTLGKMKLRAPLLMTPEYIKQSQDVFAVELLDFQFNHQVVYGQDPFIDLKINKTDVRLQCERLLKGLLIGLRQGYIRSMGRPKLVGRLLVQSAAEFLVIIRALIWLKDAERQKSSRANLDKTAELFEFDPEKIRPTAQARLEHRRLDNEQVESCFQDFYQVVDQLARQVDKWQV